MEARAAEVKRAFAQEFITPSGRLGYNDQTSYALAFLWDLIPAEHVEAAKRYFRRSVELTNGKIGTGFIGTPALLPALVKIGEPDLAEALFLQEDVPGWLYQVKRGATTIWERWDAIQADGTIFDARHELLQPLCLWRGLPVAVRGRRGLPARPGEARLQAHRLRADDPPRARLRAGEPRLARRADRGGLDARGRRGDYTVRVPEGARACWFSARTMPRPTVDGAALGRDPDGKVRQVLELGRAPYHLPPGVCARVRRCVSTVLTE